MYVLTASRAEARMDWLNRLRSSKGFPVEPELKMEDFLDSSRSQDRSPTFSSRETSENRQVKTEKENETVDVKGDVQGGYLQPNSNGGFAKGEKKVRTHVKGAKKKKHLAAVKEEKKDWVEMTNSALAELFCMRQESRMWKLNDRKKMKRRRKQEKPRICPSVDTNLTPPLSANDDNGVEKPVKTNGDAILTSLPLSALNSVAVVTAKNEYDGETSPVKKRKGFRQIVDDGIDGSNRTNADIYSSSCYLRTEVTVIDTSVSIWRSRKVMYRKGGMWKVRDKKAKSVSEHCTVSDELLPIRKTSPRLSTVEDNNAADCSPSAKIQTRRAHDFNYNPSSKDTNGHDEVRTEVKEHNVPETRNRCGRKRHLYSGSNDCNDDGTIAEFRRQETEESLEVVSQSNICPDHPVNQPIETLLVSLYQVFLQAGKMGLTAREAVSRIIERGLPGLHGEGVVPRIQVAKILRTSPYFIQLEESKFFLCSAIIGNEGQRLCFPINLRESREEVVAADETLGKNELGKKEKQSVPGSWQYWAAVAAIKRVRTSRRNLRSSQSKVGPCLSRESVRTEEEVNCSQGGGV